MRHVKKHDHEIELRFLALRLAEQMPSDRDQAGRVLRYLDEITGGFLYRGAADEHVKVVRLIARARD